MLFDHLNLGLSFILSDYVVIREEVGYFPLNGLLPHKREFAILFVDYCDWLTRSA